MGWTCERRSGSRPSRLITKKMRVCPNIRIRMTEGSARKAAMPSQLPTPDQPIMRSTCASASFEQTAVRVRALNQAFTELDKQNAETWREHGLLRNMPAATAARVEAFDASSWAAMRSSMAGGVTRYWDTHPADLDRLGRAHALAAPGMYQDDQPASMLFNRFEFYCQQITLAYYGERNVDHREVELHDQWAGIVPVQRCPSNPGQLTSSPFLL